MDGFEKTMQKASEEVRETTGRLTPPGLASPRRAGANRGWLVFAAAFAAVVLAVGVLPLLDGNGERVPVGSDPTVPVEPPSTVITTIPPTYCSSIDGPLSMARQDLPSAVLYTREDVTANAGMCDFESLEALAGPGFVTSFGGGGVEILAEWEAAGEGKLGILLHIFNMSFAEKVSGEGERYYVWPAAFAYDHWEDIPEEYLEELRAIYTEEELNQLAGFGSYAGWRTGISDDGDWMFFVAGD